MRSDRSFRRFYATLIFHANHPVAQVIFDAVLDQFVTPRPVNDNICQRKQLALRHIEYVLCQFNSTCSAIDLENSTGFNTDAVQFEFESADVFPSHIGELFENDGSGYFSWDTVWRRNFSKLNEGQREAFIRVMTAIDADPMTSSNPRLFFLEGAGGTGKTFLYNTIIATLFARCKIVRVCASTRIVATLLIQDATAHSTFTIRNDVDSTTQPNLEFEKAFAERLRYNIVIIIDEISMLHKYAFSNIDRLMLEVVLRQHSKFPFGGKVLLVGGDWKQLLPVVEGGTTTDQVKASVTNLPLFSSFTKLLLTQNMRIATGEDFAAFLNNVGRDLNFVEGSDFIEIPASNVVGSIKELISFCSKGSSLDSPLENCAELCQNAILCPTNGSVTRINNQILDRLNGTSRTYVGLDRVIGEGSMDALSVHISDTCIEQVHQKSAANIPNYELQLKVGAIVMLLRNLDIPNGLCNGTRLQILALLADLIKCRVVSKDVSNPKIVYIPRVSSEFGTANSDLSVHFKRIQFPVRPAFAMTINKGQGQTLQRVGIDLSFGSAFSHGQLYTALSRVKTFDSFRIYVGTNESSNVTVRNVVARSIISSLDST